MSDDTTTQTPPPPPPPPPPGPPGPPPGGPGVHRLRRSTTDRFLGGVAGGIAATYGIDPIIVRVAFVVATTLGGAGLVAYLLLWALLPPDDGSLPLVRQRHHEPGRIIGIVLLALGAITVVDRLSSHPGRDVFDVFWPLALIAGGLAILVLRANSWAAGTAVAPAPPVPPAPSSPPPAASAGAAGAAEAATAPAGASTQSASTQSAWAPPAPWPVGPPPRPPFVTPFTPPRARREPSFLAPLTVSALLLFVGGAAFLSAIGALAVDPAVIASIALVIVGAALCVGAFYGRARGLIALGIVGTMIAGTLATIDVPLRGGIGERRYHPSAIESVRSQYRLGIGDLRVDLSDIPVTATTRDIDVEVRIGIGQARVIVPDGVTLDLEGHSGAGAVHLLGRDQNGVDADDAVRVPGATEGAPVVHVDARAGLGAVIVERPVEALR